LISGNTEWGQDLVNLADGSTTAQGRPLQLKYELPLIDPRLAGIRRTPDAYDRRNSGASRRSTPSA
jgi:hypothetical protein